jgi:hypothetical protein
MKRNVLLIDAALAVGLAAIVLIVAPGLAVVAIVALLVLLACGVSLGIGRIRRGRRRTGHRARRTPVSRRPPARRPPRPTGSSRPSRANRRRPTRGR